MDSLSNNHNPGLPLLPLERLSPMDFERLCLSLLRRQGFDAVEHVGTSGRDVGYDMVGHQGGRRIAVQCKRRMSFSPAEAEATMNRFLALPPADRPDKLLLLVTCEVNADTRARIKNRTNELVCDIWSRQDIDQLVKRHADILRSFFGLQLTKLGEPVRVFISYGAPDQAFASRLNETLAHRGVDTFLFSQHARPGEKLHRLMRDGVNGCDRVVLVCSEKSLDRAGVLNEIEEALQREAREGGESILIPITLDDYVFTDWAPRHRDVAQAIRDRVVADFRGAERDPSRYDKAVERLVVALEDV